MRQSAGRIHVSDAAEPRVGLGSTCTAPARSPSMTSSERDGIAVTSVARTLLDMSPGQPVDRVARWMHEAGVQRVLDQREVWAVLDASPGASRAPVLEAALALEAVPTRSGAEAAYLAIWNGLELPRVRVNEWVWTGEKLEECDFVCRDLRVIIEIDGRRYHSSRYRRRKDAEKHARLRDAGWLVERFSDVALSLDRDGVEGPNP